MRQQNENAVVADAVLMAGVSAGSIPRER